MVPSLSALGFGVQHGSEYWWGGELRISGCLSGGPSWLEGITETDTGGHQRRLGPAHPAISQISNVTQL